MEKSENHVIFRWPRGGGGTTPPVPLPRQCARWSAALWQVACGAALSQWGARGGTTLGTAGTISEVGGSLGEVMQEGAKVQR
jgi:hypothetical protein